MDDIFAELNNDVVFQLDINIDEKSWHDVSN